MFAPIPNKMCVVAQSGLFSGGGEGYRFKKKMNFGYCLGGENGVRLSYLHISGVVTIIYNNYRTSN
jgi:hypothetical protein